MRRRTRTSGGPSPGGVGFLMLLSLNVLVVTYFWVGHVKAVHRSMRQACGVNLRRVGEALTQFAADHDGSFPSYSIGDEEALADGPVPAEDATAVGSFAALVSEGYLKSNASFACPEVWSRTEGRRTGLCSPRDDAELTSDLLDYAYVAGLTQAEDADSPLALDDVGEGSRTPPDLRLTRQSNHGKQGINVLYLDGHAVWVSNNLSEMWVFGDRHSTVAAFPSFGHRLIPPEGARWRVRWE